jgi:hypothetical protein
MQCQNCSSPESLSSLADMRTTFFKFNNQLIDYMSCFTSCKNIKIEDEKNAKICSNCMLQLKAEYTLKQLKLDGPVRKTEPDISENYPTNINNGVDPVKLEIKTDETNVEAEKETNVQYQIVLVGLCFQLMLKTFFSFFIFFTLFYFLLFFVCFLFFYLFLCLLFLFVCMFVIFFYFFVL